MKYKNLIFLILVFFIGCSNDGPKIIEESRSLKTYPFSEPNPIPILSKDRRLYPYHSFVGYSHDGFPQDWKIIKMENQHIEIYILPEVGGKVWGAIDKSNGEEFIYRNEVMKFRNISLRGPWTSGGIEFNFGVIGHTPATATPVDYTTRKNQDGSVSTFVGGIDLPSRTHWRVEINLEKDRSNFKTKAIWYNPTPSVQAYYNWMTAAAFAQDDLEMIFPGNKYLKHSGEVKSWPVDNEGRNLTYYNNNRFEGHKSYHVVGQWKNFFGGYYHSDNYGFGHWAKHDEMPGQKLWLWALSDEGGIWEDHLTDNDGQYVEFQAGRQWVQYSPGDHSNPVRKAEFAIYDTDQWTEYWFPVKETEGMNEASKDGVMNVLVNDSLKIKLHSFINKKGTIKVISGKDILKTKTINFKPMELHALSLLNPQKPFEVKVEELDLHYRSDPKTSQFDRSFKTDTSVSSSIPEQDIQNLEGYELLKERRFAEAEKIFKKILFKMPNDLNANSSMADLYFRKGKYEEGLKAIKKVLSINGYDAKANFLAGNIYRSLEKYNDAKEAFGWAARSTAYRSASFTQMAEIYLINNKWKLAKEYASNALDYNRFNINAMQVLILANRKSGNIREAKEWINTLLSIDPLHHFANLEAYYLNSSKYSWDTYLSQINNEYSDQTHLELAISYFNRGIDEGSIELLERISINNPINQAWLAYLKKDKSILNSAKLLSPEFVFPFRRETIEVLKWSVLNSDDWKWKYYLALNYWAKDSDEEALEIMNSLKDIPNYGPFYAARASLKEKMDKKDISQDLERSILLSSESWPIQLNAVKYYQSTNNWKRALELSTKVNDKFPNNFDVQIMHVKSLLNENRFDDAILFLDKANVLPSEMARESRQLYEWVNLAKAIEFLKMNNIDQARVYIEKSREWPKNLGIGKPYNPDESLQGYLNKFLNKEISKNELIKELNLTNNKKSGYGSKLINDIIKAVK